MEVSRYIKQNDMNDFITEIKKYRSFRFVHNPIFYTWNHKESEYQVRYTIEVTEANKLSEFFRRIHERDNPPKVSLWNKIKNNLHNRFLWKREWYSICSRHREFNSECKLCKTGYWRNVWLAKIETLIHNHWYSLWFRWANRKN